MVSRVVVKGVWLPLIHRRIDALKHSPEATKFNASGPARNILASAHTKEMFSPGLQHRHCWDERLGWAVQVVLTSLSPVRGQELALRLLSQAPCDIQSKNPVGSQSCGRAPLEVRVLLVHRLDRQECAVSEVNEGVRCLA